MIYGPDGKPVSAAGCFGRDEKTVEIVRSFAFKMALENYGGNRYESVDLFCSQKTSALASEVDDASLALFAWCRSQVLDSAKVVIKNLQFKKGQAA